MSVAFINGKHEQQWTQPVNREELPELSVFMPKADTVFTLWAFALFSHVLPSVKSDYHCDPTEVQRSSTREAEQYLGVMPSSKASCCRKCFHITVKCSLFFLIKHGNDGRMLWAAVVPMILLLSKASAIPLSWPLCAARGACGAMLPGLAAALGVSGC